MPGGSSTSSARPALAGADDRLSLRNRVLGRQVQARGLFIERADLGKGRIAGDGDLGDMLQQNQLVGRRVISFAADHPPAVPGQDLSLVQGQKIALHIVADEPQAPLIAGYAVVAGVVLTGATALPGLAAEQELPGVHIQRIIVHALHRRAHRGGKPLALVMEVPGIVCVHDVLSRS